MEVSFSAPKEKPQIVFVSGGPGSGKNTQIAKLVRDYKFTHLSLNSLIEEEVDKKSKEGQEIGNAHAQNIASDLKVRVLAKAIKARNAKKYLIEGFPQTLEDALSFERNIRQIDVILNYEAPDEILTERLRKRSTGDSEEVINNRVQAFNEQTRRFLSFYERYGKVATIPATGSIDDVYAATIQALQPNILFLYGPPASGQEQLAERLAHLTTYRLIKIQDYWRANGLTNATDEVKIDHLINFFQTNYQRNYILHGFPENIRQVKIFVEHFAAPKRFFYFDFTRDQVENHIKDFPKQQRQLIVQDYEKYVQNRKDVINYFRKKPYFVSISDNENIEEVWNSLLNNIAPEVIACPRQPEDEFAQNYIHRLEQERGYVYVDVPRLMNDDKQRTNQASGVDGYELLKQVFFNNLNRTKFILGGYPTSSQAVELFEEQICKVKNVIVFNNKGVELGGETLEGVYHTQGKLIQINSNHLDQFDSYVKNRCRYGFLIGSEAAGKPAVSAYLKGRYVTQIVDFNATIELLKVQLSTEDNPVEEVPFSEIINHFKREFASKDRSHNILFDGWPEDKTREQLAEFIREVGAPTYVFWLDATEEILGKRFMIENKVEEVDEGEQEKIKEEVEKTKQFIQVFQDSINEGNNIQLFDIKVGISTESTLKDINNIIYKKVFLFRNLSNKTSESALKTQVINLCVSNNITFVDVEKLVNQSLSAQNELGKKLNSQAIMTDFAKSKIAPSFFTPVLISDLVTQYLQSHPSSKYVLLYNYPSAEGKQENKLYPRAIDELYQIEVNIGRLREVISVVDAPEDPTINDPFEERPVEEEVKVEVKPPKGEGEEEEEAEPEPPKEEEDEDAKPKFNPLEFNWTVSNGVPKTLAQIYRRRSLHEYTAVDIKQGDFAILGDLLKDSIRKLEEGEQKDVDFYAELIVHDE